MKSSRTIRWKVIALGGLYGWIALLLAVGLYARLSPDTGLFAMLGRLGFFLTSGSGYSVSYWGDFVLLAVPCALWIRPRFYIIPRAIWACLGATLFAAAICGWLACLGNASGIIWLDMAFALAPGAVSFWVLDRVYAPPEKNRNPS